MSRRRVDKLNNFYIKSLFLVVIRNDRARTTIGVRKKETSQINKVKKYSWDYPGLRPRKGPGESSVMANAISLQDYDSLDTINDFVSSDLEIITVETIDTNNAL